MPSLTGPLQNALASGATLVTPNRRLARRLVALHDEAQRAAERTVWPAAKALPWEAWIGTLWLDALAAGASDDRARLQTPVQASHVWDGIVAAHASPLIDARGAAGLAAEAWALAHAWGAGGESWRGWAVTDGDADDDRAAFARWADTYAGALARSGAVDAAQLPDRLVRWAPRVPAWRGAAITLAGFIELAPQQERLLAALAAAGAHIERQSTLPEAPGRPWRASGATPHDELAHALGWARTRALANPAASIAIAVEDLALRRDEVRALADDILCPALQWPGQEDAARPYNLSLGVALADVPLIAVALDLIALAQAPLPIARTAALLRSPYLGATPDGAMARARLEFDWLEQGRHEISFNEVVTALREVDRLLAERWRDARDRHRLPAAASPRGWAEAWRAWLAAAGWPGERTLSSAEYQARGAWDEALAEFVRLGPVAAKLSRADALAASRAQLTAAVFQPEAPPAPIQILGILEAAGLPFDALWVAGLAAERWPPAPQPNPLLPLEWQRERDVPRSTAARELAYTQALTAQFARAAPDVVFSYARSADDHPRSISMLVPDGIELGPEDIAIPPATANAQFARAPSRDAVRDDRAPPLPAGSRAPGGAGLIEAQSDCPFKAAATFRLGAKAWPAPIDGLSAMERGTLVHAALAAFWRDVGDQRALIALEPDALAGRIAAATTAAAFSISSARWRTLSSVVVAGEAARIAALMAAWLNGHELLRPAFAVLDVEASLPLILGGLVFGLKLDRLDALAGGGTIIIDYKTGRTKAPDAWFEPRPQAPQLGLYALARRAAAPAEPVRAVAYVQMKPGEFKVQGLSADALAWPGLRGPADLKHAGLADWADVEGRWTESLGALAAEVAAGEAAVTPRDTKTTCRHCGLQPLCRIGALAQDEGDGDDDE